MEQLTQAQVLAYNKKVTEAKEKASQDKARKDLAEKELKRTCEELSAMLGKEITPDNLEAEYESFVVEAQKTMESGTKILAGLDKEQEDAMDRGESSTQPVTTSMSSTTATETTQGGLDIDDLLGL